MDVSDLMPIPQLENCKSILCVQPHPDDNEVGAGATIAKLALAGCRITYLTVTDGRNGTVNPDVKPDQLAATRKKEVELSGAILGVSESIFLDFKDGSYPDEEQLCRSIATVIRKVRPECVMTTDPFLPYEFHPDHRRVGMAAVEACMFSGLPFFKGTDGKDPADTWSISAVALYSTAYPNTFIPVDMTWDKKIAAIAAHKSQFDEQTLQMLGSYFDFKARTYAKDGAERAEAFKVLSPNHLHVNVDTIRL